MKTLFKLVVAVVLLNAVARGAWATWNYYQLRDTAQQLVTFGSRNTSRELQKEILSRASQLQVPLKPEDVKVHRDGARTIAEASYTLPVEFFPNYPYPVTFSFLVDAFSLGGPPPPKDDEP